MNSHKRADFCELSVGANPRPITAKYNFSMTTSRDLYFFEGDLKSVIK